jgi:hypothetical protein
MIPIVCKMKIASQIKNLRRQFSRVNDRNFNLLKKCVIEHRQIVRFVQKLDVYFGASYLIETSLIGIFLCILTFKLIIASNHYDVNEFIYFFGFAFVMLIKIALPCHFGQQIIDESDELMFTIYDLPWYESNIKFRHCVMILMERTQKCIKVRIQGLYDFDYIYFSAVSTLKIYNSIRCFRKNLYLFFHSHLFLDHSMCVFVLFHRSVAGQYLLTKLENNKISSLKGFIDPCVYFYTSEHTANVNSPHKP